MLVLGIHIIAILKNISLGIHASFRGCTLSFFTKKIVQPSKTCDSPGFKPLEISTRISSAQNFSNSTLGQKKVVLVSCAEFCNRSSSQKWNHKLNHSVAASMFFNKNPSQKKNLSKNNVDASIRRKKCLNLKNSNRRFFSPKFFLFQLLSVASVSTILRYWWPFLIAIPSWALVYGTFFFKSLGRKW